MPDPQPLSNRQRKILERQAEMNREKAAAKRADTRTPFREAELQFLSRQPQPDFSLALDFRQPADKLLQNPKIHRVQLKKTMGEFSELFGVKDQNEDKGLEDKQKDEGREFAYFHSDHPGTVSSCILSFIGQGP